MTPTIEEVYMKIFRQFHQTRLTGVVMLRLSAEEVHLLLETLGPLT